MKKLLVFQISLLYIFSYAQKNCEYNTNVTDRLGSYKATKEYIIHERTFGNTQATLFFSLINADGLPSLKLQLIQKSNDFIAAKCFDKTSKIFFQLSDNKIITLIAIDNETCGEKINNENVNNRLLTGYFLFMKDTMEALKNAPISIMRIKYTTETVDYIIKDELISEIDKKVYNPDYYFVNYLKCIMD